MQLADCPDSETDNCSALTEEVGCGASVGRLCYDCDNLGKEAEATHQCPECNGVHLCKEHATSHATKPRRTGGSHQPQELVKTITETRTPAAPLCTVHPGAPLSDYCLDCSALSCAQCRHKFEGHEVRKISDVVAQKRQDLAESIQQHRLSAASAGGDVVGQVLLQLEKDRQWVVEEQIAESNKIEDIYEEIQKDKMAKLDQLQGLCKKNVDAIAAQEQRLRPHQESLSNTLKDGQQLLDALQTDPATMVRHADLICSNLRRLTEMKDRVREDWKYVPPTYVGADVPPVRSVRKQMKNIVSVSESQAVSFAASTITIPPYAVCDDVLHISVVLKDSLHAPISVKSPIGKAITAALHKPNGKRVNVIQSRDISDTAVLNLDLKAEDAGEYRLEIDAGRSKHVSPFIVRDVQHYDGGCTPNIQMTDGNRFAVLRTGTGSGPFGSVAAKNSISAASSSVWHVKVLKYNATFAAGLTGLPVQDQYTVTDKPFFGECSYFWQADGQAHCDGRPAAEASMVAWQQGDVLTFTWDADERSLSCQNGHTEKKKKKMTNVTCDLSRPLHPALCLWSANHHPVFSQEKDAVPLSSLPPSASSAECA